jgi:aminoglycoside 3-N-acetyltransferase
MNKVEQLFYKCVDQLGIKKGDLLFISSDITKLIINIYLEEKKRPDVNTIIDYFVNLVGDEGTVIVPTYNWDFCKGKTFDWKKTPCKTGGLGITCLKRKDFKRTKHPIYSYAVFGKEQEYLCNIDFKSSFGDDSILAYLDKHHAKNLLIDVPLKNCFTFIHYVEQNSGLVKYRYEKDFTAGYVDQFGKNSIRTYSMFVRDLDLDVQNDCSEIEKEFLSLGIAKEYFCSGIRLLFIQDLHDAYEPALDDIKNNRSKKLCKYIGQ